MSKYTMRRGINSAYSQSLIDSYINKLTPNKMDKLIIDQELKVIEISIILFDALALLGIDTKSITVSELYTIKKALFEGINEVNKEREQTIKTN